MVQPGRSIPRLNVETPRLNVETPRLNHLVSFNFPRLNLEDFRLPV